MREAQHLNPAGSAHDQRLVSLQAHALDKLAVGGQLVDVIYKIQHERRRRRPAYLVPVSHLDHLPPAHVPQYDLIEILQPVFPSRCHCALKAACHAHNKPLAFFNERLSPPWSLSAEAKDRCSDCVPCAVGGSGIYDK